MNINECMQKLLSVTASYKEKHVDKKSYSIFIIGKNTTKKTITKYFRRFTCKIMNYKYELI